MSDVEKALRPHVESGAVPGLAWSVTRGDDVDAGAAGVLDLDTGAPVRADTIFRISSSTKPITAAAALLLVQDGVLRLDDPVDDLLPELADRRVLVSVEGPLDDTVPAERPISLRDLLTFRLGLGMDFSWGQQSSMQAIAERGLPMGPPQPASSPPPDEYLRILGSVPLEHQPGAYWMYHVGADVLGVLIARATGSSFGTVLAERIFAPLGMVDTGFFAAERLGPLYATESGERRVFDPSGGQWASPPPFEGGGAGLVSTAADLRAFGRALLDGDLLSRETVAAMTTNQVGDAMDGTGETGWGFGVGVQLRDRRLPAGTFGWDGGLGTVWQNDPATRTTAVLLTNEAWTSPEPPGVVVDFLAAAFS